MLQTAVQRWSVRTVGWITAAFGAMSLLAFELRTPSVLKVGAILGACFTPFIVYYAYTQPLLFPYGAYVALMPFDGLLMLGKIGTLTKFLGIGSAALLVLWSARKSALVAMRWPLLLVMLLGVWTLCSIWWSVDAGTTIAAVPTYLGLMLLFAALALTPITFKQYRTLLFAAVAAGTAAALYGAYAFYSDPVLTVDNDPGGRLFKDSSQSTIDPNFFADALLFPFAIVLLCALNAKSVFVKLAFYALTAVFLVAIALSASREAAIAVGAIGLYYFLVTEHRIELGISAVAALFAASTVPNPLWSRFTTLDSPRQSIWGVGLEAFKHQWLGGYGLGTFSQVYDRFYLKVYQVYPNGWNSPAHNVAVHYMVELGAVGLILIVGLFLVQFFELRVIRYGSPLYDYRLMCEAGLIGIACSALFIDLFNAKWAWFVLAMAAQLRNTPVSLRVPLSDRRTAPLLPHGDENAVRTHGRSAP